MDTPPTCKTDSGSKIRLAFDAIKRYGVCKETAWAYDSSKTNVQPSFIAYKEAIQNKITAYYRITSSGEQKLQEIKNALAQNHPIVFGIPVANSFRSVNSDKVIRIIGDPGDPVIGGHALVITGWSASKQAFEVRNSWGLTFGVNGYCYMHKDYIIGLSSDLWVPTI